MTGATFFRAAADALAGREIGDLADPGIAADGRVLRPASVLVPLFEEAGEAKVLLVRRSDRLGKHAGQIAFPGGSREPGEDELACALREAREEIALPPEEVEILGRLDRYTTATGFLVSPFVAHLRRWPLELVAEPGEVASIFHVSIARLVEPGVLREGTLGTGRRVNFFDLGSDVVWGATARILRQLLELSLGRALEPSGEIPWDKVRW